MTNAGQIYTVNFKLITETLINQILAKIPKANLERCSLLTQFPCPFTSVFSIKMRKLNYTHQPLLNSNISINDSIHGEFLTCFSLLDDDSLYTRSRRTSFKCGLSNPLNSPIKFRSTNLMILIVPLVVSVYFKTQHPTTISLSCINGPRHWRLMGYSNWTGPTTGGIRSSLNTTMSNSRSTLTKCKCFERSLFNHVQQTMIDCFDYCWSSYWTNSRRCSLHWIN